MRLEKARGVGVFVVGAGARNHRVKRRLAWGFVGVVAKGGRAAREGVRARVGRGVLFYLRRGRHGRDLKKRWGTESAL